MGFLEALKKMIPDEIIDGANVREVAERCVDLEIAFSPVLQYPPCDDFMFGDDLDVPVPVKVIARADGRYEIRHTAPPDFEILNKDDIKVMRARYLLLRGFYNENMHSFSYSKRKAIISYYFQDGWLDTKVLFKKRLSKLPEATKNG